jgi:hypothetical protein
MPYRTLFVLSFVGLAACAVPVPDFLGREGSGSGSYSIRPEPLPDPVPIPMRLARVEPGLRGQIVRVEAVAPTQGYFSATLAPMNGGVPDENGVMAYTLIARPPIGPQGIGPERTREMNAAIFVPNRALRNMSAVRITGSNTTQTLQLRAP